MVSSRSVKEPLPDPSVVVECQHDENGVESGEGDEQLVEGVEHLGLAQDDHTGEARQMDAVYSRDTLHPHAH